MSDYTQQGFTLIEILLVLAVSSAMLTIILTGQAAIRQQSQFTAAVEQTATAISNVKNQAQTGYVVGGTGSTANVDGYNPLSAPFDCYPYTGGTCPGSPLNTFFGKALIFNTYTPGGTSTLTVEDLKLAKSVGLAPNGKDTPTTYALSTINVKTLSVPWQVNITSYQICIPASSCSPYISLNSNNNISPATPDGKAEYLVFHQSSADADLIVYDSNYNSLNLNNMTHLLADLTVPSQYSEATNGNTNIGTINLRLADASGRQATISIDGTHGGLVTRTYP